MIDPFFDRFTREFLLGLRLPGQHPLLRYPLIKCVGALLFAVSYKKHEVTGSGRDPMAEETLGAEHSAELGERFAVVNSKFSAAIKTHLAFAASTGA